MEERVREYVQQALKESVEERADTEREKTGVFTGREVVNPVNDERDPGVRLRLRADGLRHRRASWACPRTTSATSSSRRSSACRSGPWSSRPSGEAPADQRLRRPLRATSGWSTPAQFTGMSVPEATEAIIRWLEGEGKGRARRQLPAARLARVTPALLGRADPDRLLRASAAWCPCRRSSCRCCCRTSRTTRRRASRRWRRARSS